MSPKQGASRVGKPRTKRAAVKTDTAGPKGASAQKTGLFDRWHSYLDHHRSSAQDSLQRMLVEPLQSVMTVLVMAIALALPATLLVSLNNLQVLGQQWESGPRLTVFINPKARDTAIDKLRSGISQRTEVVAVEYISAQQALQDFERESGMGSALRSLEQNPLPPALVITPQTNIQLPELQQLAEEISGAALVDDVLYDQAWIQRLYYLLSIGERLVLGIGGLLILGVLLVIGNTIRLAIENRRDEIVIIKLVGGTDAFVRRPFLYTGLWYGVAGGLIAWVLLGLGVWSLSGLVAQLAGLYQSQFELQGLGFVDSVMLLLLAAAVGWLGAWITVARQLHSIQPE